VKKRRKASRQLCTQVESLERGELRRNWDVGAVLISLFDSRAHRTVRTKYSYLIGS
jgi:hypothetical protein